MNRTRLFPSPKFYKCALAIAAVCCLIFASCNSDSSRSVQYYYSDAGLESNLPDSIEKIKLENKKAISVYIKNKTFVSKIQKLVVDDSLKTTLYVNGKKEAVMKCEITEYMVYGNRLLLMTDSITSKQAKYTLSENGIITDMQTYARYSPQE